MKRHPLDLSKRERQIVEAVYRLGEASVSEVRGELSDPPSYSSVRAMLGLLVEKKQLKFRQNGKRYLYRAALSKEKARRSVLTNLLATFFGGEPLEAMSALLDVSENELTEEQISRMRRLIEEAKKDNRQ